MNTNQQTKYTNTVLTIECACVMSTRPPKEFPIEEAFSTAEMHANYDATCLCDMYPVGSHCHCGCGWLLNWTDKNGRTLSSWDVRAS